MLFFQGHAPRSNRRTDSSGEWSNDVFPSKDGPLGWSFWGQNDGWRHMGKYIPQKLPKKGREWAVSSQNAKIFTSQYLRNY